MLVDTNVIIDAISNDVIWGDWALAKLQECSASDDLFINYIVYAELAASYATTKELDNAVEGLNLKIIDLPKEAAFLAGKAFAQYRRSGGTKTNVLSDFFIGAHAKVVGVPILTRDVRRYRRYFPDVPLIAPTAQ